VASKLCVALGSELSPHRAISSMQLVQFVHRLQRSNSFNVNMYTARNMAYHQCLYNRGISVHRGEENKLKPHRFRPSLLPKSINGATSSSRSLLAAPSGEKRPLGPSVQLPYATVVGSSAGGVDSFKGIPYAQHLLAN
jgi:hypothetical protein